MPIKPKRPCGQNGCPNLTSGYYCDEHRKEKATVYNKHYRDSESNSFYNSSAWRNLSKQKLQQQPMCEECLKSNRLQKARIADHIVPIKQGGAKLNIENLQSLCFACHNKKTAKE